MQSANAPTRSRISLTPRHAARDQHRSPEQRLYLRFPDLYRALTRRALGLPLSLFHLRDGMVTSQQDFLDRDEAFAAAGAQG